VSFMNYSNWLFLIWVVFFMAFIFVSRRKKRFLFIGIVLILFVPLFLPRQVWGKWDSISMLNGKQISKVLLKPSEPGWDVNLTDSLEVIVDSNQINQLMGYLRKTELYFPNHPRRIWETKLIFVTKEKDSISFQIQKTENNGTVIYSPNNQWRKDEIAEYLERIVNFSRPVKGKKS
ncbi:MAG TPA: hypothetical protein VI233_10990, partial [Puia sp.]